MKSKTLFKQLCIIAAIFLTVTIKANENLINKPGAGLEIASMLLFNEERITNYTLIIYDENQSSDTIVVTKAKHLYFKLRYGHFYSLRYIKKGYKERIVMIDTRLDEANSINETGFDFEIEMIPENQQGNTISDLPVALINYNYSEKKFEYSRNYHRQIRGKEITELVVDN